MGEKTNHFFWLKHSKSKFPSPKGKNSDSNSQNFNQVQEQETQMTKEENRRNPPKLPPPRWEFPSNSSINATPNPRLKGKKRARARAKAKISLRKRPNQPLKEAPFHLALLRKEEKMGPCHIKNPTHPLQIPSILGKDIRPLFPERESKAYKRVTVRRSVLLFGLSSNFPKSNCHISWLTRERGNLFIYLFCIK